MFPISLGYLLSVELNLSIKEIDAFSDNIRKEIHVVIWAKRLSTQS